MRSLSRSEFDELRRPGTIVCRKNSVFSLTIRHNGVCYWAVLFENGNETIMNLLLLWASLLAGYVFARTILPLPWRWRYKIPLLFFLLLIANKFHVLHLFGGPRAFAPELPAAVLFTAAYLYAALFFFAGLLLASEVVFGIFLLVRKFRRKPAAAVPARFRSQLHCALLGIAMLIAAIGIWRGTATPGVREIHLAFDNLPPETENFRIAVIADLHVDRCCGEEKLREIVRRTNAAQPDLTLLIGDLVDGTVPELQEKLSILSGLRARYGVFGVPGNHEYYSGFSEWKNFWENTPVRMLLNEAVLLPGHAVALVGVTDPAARRFRETVPDLGAAVSGIPVETFRILLAHQPRFAPEAAARNIDLQISGHTHGGMILGFAKLIGAFNGGFSSGCYSVNGMTLYVTNGSGIWSGFPIRLGREAEIALLCLHGKNN